MIIVNLFLCEENNSITRKCNDATQVTLDWTEKIKLAYELTYRRCSCIYQLGSKFKRAGQPMQFVQVLALFNQ